MAIMDLLNINLSKIPADGMKLEITLDGDFFTALDQDRIKGGTVKVNLNIREHSGEVYTLKFIIQGEVIVHTIIIVVFLALLIIPLRRLHQSFEGVGINMSYPKLLIYPFLLPIYRTNKRILAFFYRKKCVRRL